MLRPGETYWAKKQQETTSRWGGVMLLATFSSLFPSFESVRFIQVVFSLGHLSEIGEERVRNPNVRSLLRHHLIGYDRWFLIVRCPSPHYKGTRLLDFELNVVCGHPKIRFVRMESAVVTSSVRGCGRKPEPPRPPTTMVSPAHELRAIRHG